MEISGGLTVTVKTGSVELMREVVPSEGTSVGDGKAELNSWVGTVDTPALPVGAEDPSEADPAADEAVMRLEIVLDELEDDPQEGSTIEVDEEASVPLYDDPDEDGAGEESVEAGALASWTDDGAGSDKSDGPKVVVEASPN